MPPLSTPLATFAMLAFGAGDFLGGLAVRRGDWRRVLPLAFASGAIVCAVAALLLPASSTALPWRWCGAGGICLAVGVTLLFRALAAGQMTQVAPVSAMVAIAVPVLVEVTTGAVIEPAILAGIMLAAVGAFLLASGDQGSAGHASRAAALRVALVAGLALAGFYVALDHVANTGDTLVSLVAIRGTALLITAAFAMFGSAQVSNRSSIAPAIGAGVLDGLACVLLLLAFRRGGLAQTSAIASLYPVATVLLAAGVLHERPSPRQRAGLLLVVPAILLLQSS